VAIKILEKDKIKDQSDVERVTREIHILKIVRHPNVVQLYEVSIQHLYLYISTKLFNPNFLYFTFSTFPSFPLISPFMAFLVFLWYLFVINLLYIIDTYD